MKYLRALKGLEPGIYFGLWMSAIQVAIGVKTNLNRLGLEPGEDSTAYHHFQLSPFYLFFFVSLISLFLNIKPRRYDPKPEMGELQLQLPLITFRGNFLRLKSKRFLMFEIFLSLLLIPFIYFVFKFLENLVASQIRWQPLAEFTIWSTVSLIFLLHVTTLVANFLSNKRFQETRREIREGGIILGGFVYTWEELFDYEWLSSGQVHYEQLGTKFRVPQGFNALKIRYLIPKNWAQKCELLTLIDEASIFCHEKDRAVVEQILANKLPKLSQDCFSNTLRFHECGTDLSLKNTSTVISGTGIFHTWSTIDFQTIVACQWKDPKPLYIWASRLISLNFRKKIYILRVRWTDHQRLKWTEIPVPAALVAQVHAQLLKYLPEHAEINLPPSR